MTTQLACAPIAGRLVFIGTMFVISATGKYYLAERCLWMGKSSQYIITEEELTNLWEDVPYEYAVEIFARVRSRPYQSEREKVLEHIPEILVCQSLPNEHGFCGANDCFCKELHRVESGDICKWMQENRLRQAGEP